MSIYTNWYKATMELIKLKRRCTTNNVDTTRGLTSGLNNEETVVRPGRRPRK